VNIQTWAGTWVSWREWRQVLKGWAKCLIRPHMYGAWFALRREVKAGRGIKMVVKPRI